MNSPARALAVCLLLALAGGGALWLTTRERRPDPAASLRSGAIDDTAYVGNERCARCHPGEAFRHARSGHARTLTPAVELKAAPALDGQVFHDGERGVTYHYRVKGAELAVSLPEKFGDKFFPLAWAFGSGEHGVSFLTFIPNQIGKTEAIEHRVSLFGKEDRLGLTPSHAGLKAAQPVEWMGRVIRDEKLADCVGCHTTTAQIGREAQVQFQANIGCERCHGPGGKHVREAEREEPVSAVPFGGATTSADAQIRMCSACHRHPDQLKDTIMSTDNPRLARFQPVGLMQSACFRKSSGRMSCTTCHDPHEHAPRERELFDGRCLACHGTGQGQSPLCPVSPSENCVACHMPEIDVRPGTKFHDHWIRVRSSESLPSDAAPDASPAEH